MNSCLPAVISFYRYTALKKWYFCEISHSVTPRTTLSIVLLQLLLPPRNGNRFLRKRVNFSTDSYQNVYHEINQRISAMLGLQFVLFNAYVLDGSKKRCFLREKQV